MRQDFSYDHAFFSKTLNLPFKFSLDSNDSYGIFVKIDNFLIRGNRVTNYESNVLLW